MNTDLVAYYRARANEYEQIYQKPERQESIRLAGQALENLLRDGNVLEIACGTGFWTEKIAQTASSIVATDINNEVIDIARSKDYRSTDVLFQATDLYDLSAPPAFEALFAGFIWSHIPLQQLDRFLHKVSSLVKLGGIIVFMDNIYVEGSSTPVGHKDEEGNTWQDRTLADGSRHRVLKNFPTEALIKSGLPCGTHSVEYTDLEYFWLLSYRLL
jgi:2-polyprenyl-3-methyl-5-hydroxy-6-metoxy-1,4-benzoquinol methylase